MSAAKEADFESEEVAWQKARRRLHGRRKGERNGVAATETDAPELGPDNTEPIRFHMGPNDTGPGGAEAAPGLPVRKEGD